MSRPKLHHYVPQFYLSLFVDGASQLWVWDKKEDRVFPSASQGIAAKTNFYRFTDLSGTAKDPFLIEKEMAKVEGHAAAIMARWHTRLEAMKPLEKLRISKNDRGLVSLFLALQYLRTLESREILALFALENGFYSGGISDEEKVNLHATLLLNGGVVPAFQRWIQKSIWIFAKNLTDNPFLTSDNPVCFKTPDNRMWLKAPGVLSEGNYLVYPMTPKFILYCKDGSSSHWRPVRTFRDTLSPVTLSEEMVDHENSGQVFMASRFIISSKNDFRFPRSFARDFLSSTGNPI